MDQIFTNVYESKLWGNNNHSEYNGSSGGGSSIEYNEHTYIPFLKQLISNNDIKSVVDLGCGDFRCGALIYNDLNVVYTGYDTYKKVIDFNSKQYLPPKYSFIHLDFCNKKEEIVGGDLCILKDVLQHWCLNDIYQFLDFLVQTKKFKYILICNCCYQTQHNTDIANGDWRPLSCDFFPLQRYSPTKLYNYDTKEVCVIRL